MPGSLFPSKVKRVKTKQKSRAPTELDERAAKDKCLRLLGLRPRSAAELRARLSDSGFEDEVIGAVVGELTRSGLVDDEEFARAWVASRQASGGAGRQKLRWELRQKGLSEHLIRRFVDEGIDDQTEIQQALCLARKRLKGDLREAKTLARLRRLLLGRGFGFETVDRVLQQLTTEGEH